MNFFKRLFQRQPIEPQKMPDTQEYETTPYDQLDTDEQPSIEIGDVVLLYWIDTSTSDELPWYFEDTYKINPQKHRNKLVRMGLLKTQKSHRSLSKLKVVDLKDILRKNDLPVSGKKAILIERILDNYPKTEPYIPASLCLTDEGETVVQENQWIIDAHRDIDITPFEYALYRDKFPDKTPFEGIKEQILINRIVRESGLNHYGFVRSDYLALAKMKQENNKRESLMYYIVAALLDASGIANNLEFMDRRVPIYDEDGMMNAYVVTALRNAAEECDHDEYLDVFQRAENIVKSFNEEMFLTKNDFKFIQDNILIQDLQVIETYLAKYSKYTFDYYI